MFVWRERVYFPNLWGKGVVKVDFMIVGEGWRDVAVASLENTEANEEYSGGSVGLGLDFSAAAASSVAVVSLAMIGDPTGMKRYPHQMIL